VGARETSSRPPGFFSLPGFFGYLALTVLCFRSSGLSCRGLAIHLIPCCLRVWGVSSRFFLFQRICDPPYAVSSLLRSFGSSSLGPFHSFVANCPPVASALPQTHWRSLANLGLACCFEPFPNPGLSSHSFSRQSLPLTRCLSSAWPACKFGDPAVIFEPWSVQREFLLVCLCRLFFCACLPILPQLSRFALPKLAGGFGGAA